MYLEEGDYDYEWKISTEHNSYKIGYDISDLIRSYSYTGDGSVFHHDFLKSVTICINVLGVDGKAFFEVSSKTVDEVKSDMLRFKTLLDRILGRRVECTHQLMMKEKNWQESLIYM